MQWLVRTGDFVRSLRGWRAWSLAFAAGALSALAFAPFGFFPFLLLGFACLVLLLDGAHSAIRPVRVSAGIGWAFGFGQFLVGLHWVGYAFLVDAIQHAWQIPFVAILFPGGLAIFYAAAAAAAARFWTSGQSRIFAFTSAVSLAEWLRGHVLTGFPWNIPAYGWGASLSVMQSVSLFGAYGLTLLTILFGASLAQLFGKRCEWRLPFAMALVFAGLFVGGELRLTTIESGNVVGVRLRIVQPNIAQTDKYRPALIDANWNRLIALSQRPSKLRPTLVIWPEAAPPFLLTRAPDALDEIAVLTGRDRILMTGALRALKKGGKLHYYNSFYIFGHGGQLLAVYDKFHLVPFGEYLPFESLMNRLGLTKLVGVAGSFSTGDGPHTLPVPGAPPVGPLICYEILFPGEVVGGQRPGWFVNVTDDSWFGPWAGPQQHLLVARMRAIEEGIPVIRAANTGVSAIIDPLGRLRESLGLNRTGVLDGWLPVQLDPTFYARFGEFGFCVMLLASLLSALVLGRKGGK